MRAFAGLALALAFAAPAPAQPGAAFRPYRHPELDRLAAELDGIFDRIAADAAGR